MTVQKILDVICVGDSTVDTFIRIHDAAIECDINQKDCRICIDYGEKIPVDSIAHGVAGNAANVVVGCAKIGLKTAIYTHVGLDWQGDMIVKNFRTEGVSEDYVVAEREKSSNLSVVLSFKGERTIFVYHQQWRYKLPKLPVCKWLYFTSVSASFTNSGLVEEVCHYIDQTRTKLAFSPGTYQLKVGIKKYPKLLEKCDLIFVNADEAKEILGIDRSEKSDVGDLLSKMLLLGPKIVVITDGDQGSYAADGKNYFKVGVYPARLIEKTGAGDAYASGFISALILKRSLEEAMVWGAINAAHVVGYVGAQRGLLTQNELERHRKVVRELEAKNFQHA